MPVDIPQLKEDLAFHSYMKHSTSSRSIYEAARAVVEAPIIQWCTTHGEQASMQWPDSNWQCHYQGVCRVEPMLLVDPT